MRWSFSLLTVVNSTDNELLILPNQGAVNPEKDPSREAQVPGHLTEDGSLHVDSIAAAGG